MSDAAVVVNISDMIDLAIGTPEVGVVDFNMLQTVLHCLAQQLRVSGKNVELRGSLTTLPVSRDNVQTIAVSEFVIETGDETPAKVYKEIKDRSSPPLPADESILVVERVKKTDSPLHGTGARSTPSAIHPAPSAGPPFKAPSPIPAAPVPVPSGPGPEKLSLVTLSKFNLLENTVADLQKRVYGSIPKNEDILEEVRSQTNLKAITDMWTNLNVSSRLEAAENGIAKLSSLVQDLIGETVDLQRKASQTSQPQATGGATAKTPPPSALAKDVSETSGKISKTGGIGGGGGGAGTGSPDLSDIYDTLNKMQNDIDTLADAFYSTMDDIGVDVSTTGPPQASEQSGGETTMTAQAGGGHPGQAGQAGKAGEAGQSGQPGQGEQAGQGGQAGQAGQAGKPGQAGQAGKAGQTEEGGQIAKSKEGGAMKVFKKHSGVHGSEAIAAINDRLNDLDRRITECCDKLTQNFGILLNQFNSLEDQLSALAKQVYSGGTGSGGGVGSGGSAGGGIGGGGVGRGGPGHMDPVPAGLSPDLVKDLQGLMHLFTTVQDMQGRLAEVHETALHLAAEKEDRQHHINALLEQIELLKAVKMDREDMAEAMAEKADLRALARKVSHDQFEMACDDLSRGLEHAIGKLNMQEALWQQALDDIQREIETKLDKMELSPVKDFFNNKLKQLQENLKQMASLRREAEAAGTKRKLLRDVNCISCDAKAIMAMEAAVGLPASKPMPPNLSMKPYLSYELDAIRKAQATNMPQRNMHDWETIDKQMQQPKVPQRVRSDTDKHLCNRYCGGSHTVTTPAQRVARLGHFIKQWGPDVLPLSSGLAAGDDGKMYKVTNLEATAVESGGAVDTAAPPKAPPKKIEDKKPQGKPIVISAECRCLDTDGKGKS